MLLLVFTLASIANERAPNEVRTKINVLRSKMWYALAYIFGRLPRVFLPFKISHLGHLKRAKNEWVRSEGQAQNKNKTLLYNSLQKN